MKLKEIASMSLSQLRSLAPADLKLAYKRTREAALARQKTFKSKGLTTALPKAYRGNIPTAASFDTPAELRHALKDLADFVTSEKSYYFGYRNAVKDQMTKYNNSPWAKNTGIQFNSIEEFDEYGKFMKAMEDRMLGSWASGGSDDAGDIFKESQRLGVNPIQFAKNFEYWNTHLKDLQSAKRLNRSELNASDYVKSLKLENISTFYKREKLDRMYYSANKKKKGK